MFCFSDGFQILDKDMMHFVINYVRNHVSAGCLHYDNEERLYTPVFFHTLRI